MPNNCRTSRNGTIVVMVELVGLAVLVVTSSTVVEIAVPLLPVLLVVNVYY